MIAQPIKPQIPAINRLHFGAAYYPEHWPSDRLEEDILLMKQAHVSVVRMAEFAWSQLEPRAGIFTLDWLDRAIHKLADAGIVSVLGTPTAAPPAWLVEQYPEMMAVDEYGRRVQFGNRCHYCVTSPEFHQAVQRIIGALGERFGSSPSVIGWQLDNEFNRVCYCERCKQVFHEYLREIYHSLDVLNEAWSTAYWSQTYTDWSQIPLPIGSHNPGLKLAHHRFVTRSYRSFQRLQIETLRPYLHSEAWITHNFMTWFGAFDHYEMSADLDLASLDYYVGKGHFDYHIGGASIDAVRGYKQRNFWLMETQPGHVNWQTINTALNKNEGRALAWSAISRGADAVMYWQWRPALNGQEQLHGSLIDQSGQPRPFFSEASRLGREMERLSPLLANSHVKAQVAILYDFDSRWSIESQPHHKDFNYIHLLENYYQVLASKNLEVDIISADVPIFDYRLVIAPALTILDEDRVAKFKEFVRRGGHLLLTARTGVKDRNNAFLPYRPPGPLASLTGVEVEEFYALEEPVPVTGNWFNGNSELWAERLRILADRVAVIARFGRSNGWLDGQAAITVQVLGIGHVYYVGVQLDEIAQYEFFSHVLKSANLRGRETPDGVEWRTRVRMNGQEVHIIINHSQSTKSMVLPWPAYEHLSNQIIPPEVQLGSYAVAIITQEKE